jgi:ketosteroid isomerase-like protein
MTVSDELKARREAVIQAHLDAETSMDVDAVLATLREDAAYELPTINRTFRGHAEIRSFLEAVFAALPGVAHHAERIYHTDDAVLVETASDVPGMAEPARTVSIFPFDGDQSLGERLYADMSLVVASIDAIGTPSP